MTSSKKLPVAGGLALVAGILLMAVVHQLAWRSFGADSGSMLEIRMPAEMPWFMPLGPLAMALTFVGGALLIVSLVRWTRKIA